MTNRKTGKETRFTSAMKQELISRCHLSERLVDFGWLPTSPILDLGEDFLVQIYFDSKATGVVFQIQEKSVTDLHKYRLKRSDCLSYPFPVKDLNHWAGFDLPVVVLVVWDIELREGKWIFVDEAIGDLDRRRPNWRSNKEKANVHIPWSNSMDDAGLTKLKQCIGYRLYPVIAQDRPIEVRVSLCFADTEEGIQIRKAYERLVKEGDEATFKGQTIQSVEFSEWFQNWFGEYDSEKAMLVVGSKPSSKSVAVGIDVISGSGEVASLSPIELKVVKQGTDLIQLSNEHQAYPIHFTCGLRDPKRFKECSFSCKLNDFGHSACEAVGILRFLRVLATGGTMRITFLASGGASLSFTVPPQQSSWPNRGDVQIVERVCEIQSKVGQVLRIPKEGIAPAEVDTIRKLIWVLERGQIVTRYNEATITCNRQLLEAASEGKRENRRLYIRTTEESSFNLFNNDISIGQVVRTLSGEVKMSTHELEELLATLASQQLLDVEFVDVEVVEVFPDVVEKLSIAQDQLNAA